MKKLLVFLSISFLVSGCAVVDTAKKYWPRDHDPVMFSYLVSTSLELEKVRCDDKPDWPRVQKWTRFLARYASWRNDPQSENLEGLAKHAEHMVIHGGSKGFCELGKKTAAERIEVTKEAWGGR